MTSAADFVDIHTYLQIQNEEIFKEDNGQPKTMIYLSINFNVKRIILILMAAHAISAKVGPPASKS